MPTAPGHDTGTPRAARGCARRRLQRRRRPWRRPWTGCPQSFVETVDHVLVCDDASADDTYEVGLAYQSASPLPMTVVEHPENLGYGGNQKAGYALGDRRTASTSSCCCTATASTPPRCIEDLVDPLVRGEADAVFGSRMIERGSALAGGMPLYKFVGNRILTDDPEQLTGLDLTRVAQRLPRLPGRRARRHRARRRYSNDFDFDTEIILGLHAAGKRIVEVPIPTYYGDEICYVNGMQYAKDVTVDVLRFKAAPDGLRHRRRPADRPRHRRLRAQAVRRTPPTAAARAGSASCAAARVLDVGCSDGQFGALAPRLGHHVTGVDLVKHEGVADRLDEFIEADVTHGPARRDRHATT